MVGEELAGYRLLAVLGRGGMSVVYQAENPRLSNIVAVKVLAPELATDDVFRARFLQESRIAASLSHPNVIPIYDMGPCDDLLYIAMRYVAGADLRTVLKAHGRISPEQALSLISQAGRALDAAHRSGLVHRDVKPANLLIEPGVDDDPDHVYLADFGITKHELSRTGLTATGQFVGTLAYIAPEQIQGKHVGHRADIYSLGCVLYESLTGSVPFPKPIDAAVIWAHVEEEAPPPSQVCPELPKRLDGVIARALAKDPDDRYSTCRELIEAARVVLESSAKNGASATKLSRHPDTVLSGVEPPPPRLGSPPMDPPVRPVDDAAPRPASEPASSAYPPPAAPPSAPLPPPASAASPSAPRGRDRQAGTGSRSRRHLPVIGALVLLILAGIGVWLGTRGGGKASVVKTSSHHLAGASRASNAILEALAITNRSDTAKHLIPPSTCKAQSATAVTCTHPAFGANTVTISTFPSLSALYTAYVRDAKTLGRSPFRTNFGDCTAQQTYGEVSWNHRYQHPRHYSLQQSQSGHLSDDDAAGRVFCTFTNSQLYIVWTQNDGRVLGILSGFPHANTWDWWKGIHHSIDIPGSGTSMEMPGSVSSTGMSG
jgi:serine/threonine protein kinase